MSSTPAKRHRGDLSSYEELTPPPAKRHARARAQVRTPRSLDEESYAALARLARERTVLAAAPTAGHFVSSVGWMFRWCNTMGLEDASFFLGVLLLARGSAALPDQDFRLLRMAALWVSTKMTEEEALDADDMDVPRKDLLRAEVELLRALKFYVCGPTPLDFLPANDEGARCLCFLSAFSPASYERGPEAVAAACASLSNKLRKGLVQPDTELEAALREQLATPPADIADVFGTTMDELFFR